MAKVGTMETNARRRALVDRLAATGWACDPARARSELGFEPKVAFASGLRETIEWYVDNGWL